MRSQFGRRDALRALCGSLPAVTAGCTGLSVAPPETSTAGYESATAECSFSGAVTATADWPLPRGDAARTARAGSSVPSSVDSLERRWETTVGSGAVMTPLLAGGSVVARQRAPDGVVTALDAASGDRTWTRTRDELATSVGVADGVVHVGYAFHDRTDGVGLAGFDLDGGTRQWSRPALGSVRQVVPLGDAALVVDDDGLAAVPHGAATTCWRYRPGGPNPEVTDVAVRHGTVYLSVATRQSDVPSGGTVVALEPGTGVVWTRDFGEAATGLTVGPDRVFVRLAGAVAALARDDGGLGWEVETGGGPGHGMALGDVGLVYGGSYSLVLADPATGAVRWSREVDATAFSPVVAGGVVVALGRDRTAGTGVVVVLDAAGERLAGDSIAGGQALGGPAVAGRRVVVGTADGRVVGFEVG